MDQNKIYDCIIIGGGLAGLSLSILLAKSNKMVLLIEKKSYPYHKVCGEYLSKESEDFLMRLGVHVDSFNLPRIDKFKLTSPNGRVIDFSLDLGGIGISRYKLDHVLAEIAKSSGVDLLENTTVTSYKKEVDIFKVETHKASYKALCLCASFGKHAFGNFYKPESESENWVGVKYHIQYDFPKDMIALHNFKGGYCGISAIEENRYCLCYLVKASQLNRFENKITVLEKEILRKNPYLDDIFENAQFLFDKPLTISNVKFSVKKPIFEEVFYLGDCAGSIAPLSGNGMSIALRSAHLLAPILLLLLNKQIDLKNANHAYEKIWNKEFKFRIHFGKQIQHFFCKEMLTSLSIRVLKFLTPLQRLIIKQTHGEPF